MIYFQLSVGKGENMLHAILQCYLSYLLKQPFIPTLEAFDMHQLS